MRTLTEFDSDDRHLLTALLAESDTPCPVCGANLRGVDSPRCHECSARLELCVGSIDLKLAPWVTGVVGACTSLGFVTVLALATSISGLVGRLNDVGDWLALVGFWAIGLLMAGVVRLLVRHRRRFLRLSARRQWWLAAASCALVVPTLAGVFSLMFFVAWR